MTIECVFFCESLRGCRTESEIAEIVKRRPAGLSRNRFCKLMHFNRSTLYNKPKGESEGNLRIMEEMDRYYMEHPTAGVLTSAAASESGCTLARHEIWYRCLKNTAETKIVCIFASSKSNHSQMIDKTKIIV